MAALQREPRLVSTKRDDVLFCAASSKFKVLLPGSGCCPCIPWMLVQQVADKAAAVVL